MNLKSTLMLGVCVMVSGVASAQVLQLNINTDTGAVEMVNSTGSAVQFDGYTIASASSSLDAAQWNSFADAIVGNPTEFIAQFGAAGLGMAESGAVTDASVSELTAGAGPLFQNADSFALGNLFDPTGTQDVTFEYNLSGATTGTTTGAVNYVPEPGSLALLGLGGLALLRRRR